MNIFLRNFLCLAKNVQIEDFHLPPLYSQWNKNHVEKMWNVHSEFCNYCKTVTFSEKESATWYNDYMYYTTQCDDWGRDLNAPIKDVVKAQTVTIEMVVDENFQFEQFLARHNKIKDKNAHFELRMH